MSDLLVGPIDLQEEWTNWKAKHSREYSSSEEEKRRFEIFERNINSIIEHNKKYQAGEVTWTKGLNHFADLEPEEVPKGYLGAKR